MKHLTMMRYALACLFLGTSFQLNAQKNLREGYVITLKGDTLQGVIDYRTPAMNNKRCVFKQSGETDFKTYLPGEINSYRFLNNGTYYVSKDIKTDDESTQKLFAECILRGKMNLYQVGEFNMVIEDAEGKQGSFSLENTKNATKVRELHEEMDDALALLKKSKKASDQLWEKQKSRENTKKAVKTYLEEVYPNSGYEVFEYTQKKTSKEDRMVHFWLKAGVKAIQYQTWTDNNLMGCTPRVAIGADFHLDRLCKGLMAFIGLSFEKCSASKDPEKLFNGTPGVELNGAKVTKLDFTRLDLMVGPGYQFQAGKLAMNVKAGLIIPFMPRHLDYTESRYYYRGTGNGNNVDEYEYPDRQFFNQFGWGAGFGVEYPLKKVSLTCDLEFTHNTTFHELQGLPDYVIKQNGLSLSLGVKF